MLATIKAMFGDIDIDATPGLKVCSNDSPACAQQFAIYICQEEYCELHTKQRFYCMKCARNHKHAPSMITDECGIIMEKVNRCYNIV